MDRGRYDLVGLLNLIGLDNSWGDFIGFEVI